MSARRPDVRSHPWARRPGGNLFRNQKIDESAEDTYFCHIVIILSQSSCVSVRISNQLRIFDIGLKSFNVDRL